MKIFLLIERNEVRVIDILKIKGRPSDNSQSINGNIEHQVLTLIHCVRGKTYHVTSMKFVRKCFYILSCAKMLIDIK